MSPSAVPGAVADDEIVYRAVEFEDIDHVAVSHTGVASVPEWLGEVASLRQRVHHGTPVGLSTVDLPAIESVIAAPLPGPPVSEEELLATEQRRSAAVAWAVGYRDGHEEGRRIGAETGHREGRSSGHEEALAESRAIAAALVARVEHELVSHGDDLRQLSETVAAGATELAFEIAEAVLGRELSLRTDPGADAIERAARVLPDTGARISRVVVRLHPDDLARLSEPVESLVPGRELVLQADPSVAPGGCLLDAGASRVDASIATAMARVREVLLP